MFLDPDPKSPNPFLEQQPKRRDRSEQENPPERTKEPADGWGVLISIGKWGGIYIVRSWALRIGLGWIALTIFRRDGDFLIKAAADYYTIRDILLTYGEFEITLNNVGHIIKVETTPDE